MSYQKVIYIKTNREEIPYYYFEEYNTYEEAIITAKRMKMERKKEFNLKWFIQKAEDSWFLPVPKFILYLNKKLRIL